MEEFLKSLCVHRKWFPPLRKLSHSKTDKSEKENRSGSKKSDRKSKVNGLPPFQSIFVDYSFSFIRLSYHKMFFLPQSPSTETCTDTNAINDDDVEDDVEMPPPMKPISEALLKGKEENDAQVIFISEFFL